MTPTPPELPPIRSAASSPSPSLAAPPPPSKPAVGGTRRFRQALAYTATGSAGLIAVVLGGELALKDGLKPSDLMAPSRHRPN